MVQSTITASALITFIERLQDDSAAFYKMLAEKFSESKDSFLSFAEESKKEKTLIVRTYQETITDALEACFCFQGMNLDEYSLRTHLPKATGYVDALREALQLEEEAVKFYSDAARLSESLLATMPSAFRKVAEKRQSRKQRLESLFEKSRTAH